MFLSVDDLCDDRIKLKTLKLYESEPKIQWSASYVFEVRLLDNTLIGHCDLRLDHFDSIYIAGNIGYDIDERFWNLGYATSAVKLLIKLAKKHQMEYLIITCQPNNFASKKVALKSGFKFVEQTLIPKDHQMYKEGLREVLIFKLVF